MAYGAGIEGFITGGCKKFFERAKQGSLDNAGFLNFGLAEWPVEVFFVDDTAFGIDSRYDHIAEPLVWKIKSAFDGYPMPVSAEGDVPGMRYSPDDILVRYDLLNPAVTFGGHHYF